MKICTAFLTLAVVVAAAAPLSADEVPHLLLVQGLRDRRMPDLAIEYLQKLQANPPAELAPLIPLELARTRLELANLEADGGRRLALLLQARGEFEAFVKNNAGHPLSASANLEIARVIGMLGKAKLSEAKRQEGAASQRTMAGEARKLFGEAAAKLQDAGKQIDIQLGNLPEMPTTPQERAAKQTLDQAKLQAEFEQGITYTDMARTYLDNKDLILRAENYNKAAAVFGKLSGRDPRNPLCWLARAWVGNCAKEIDNPNEALKEFDAILNEKGDQVEAAKRIARYFRLLMLSDGQYKHATIKEKFVAVQKDGEEWLRDYRRYQYTPEGFGVRWEVASACLDQATKIPPGPMKKPTQAARDLYKQAETHFKILADTENDYTLLANQRRMNIILTTAINEGDDPDKFVRFEQCFIRAQYEAVLIEDEQKAFEKFVAELPAEPLQAQLDDKKARSEALAAGRKKHYQTILHCLSRALKLAQTEKDVPPQDIIDVESMQAFVHLSLGNTYEAAIHGEFLARSKPQSNRASVSAGYALQAYAQVVAKAEGAGMMEGKELDADRKNIRRLAEFMERTWPVDPATDFARHQLAAILLHEDNYPMAVEVFGRIGLGYGHVAQARYQMALTALDLARDPAKLVDLTETGLQIAAPAAFGAALGEVGDANMKTIQKQLQTQLVEARRKYYHDKAMEALEGIPTPDNPSNLDSGTAQIYLLAKLQQGNLLFEIAKTAGDAAAKAEKTEDKAALMKDAEAKFDRLEALADSLTKVAPSMYLTMKAKEEIVPAVNALSLYAKYGRAAANMASGNSARVLTLTDPIVAEIKKGLDEGTLTSDKFGNLRRALVVLALRANVQKGNVNQAKVLLDVVQKLALQDQLPGGATSILVQIVQELKDQIDQMKADPAREAELERLKRSISTFLDALASQKDLPAETILFLGSSYSNLDEHDKAAKLLIKHKDLFLDPGPFKDLPPTPLSDADEKDEMKKDAYDKKADAYQQAAQGHLRKEQLYRTFRLMQIREMRLGASEFQGEEKLNALKKAQAELDVLLLKADWAKSSMDVRKEKVQILEDMELYGGKEGAIVGWDALMKKNNRSTPQLAVQYFDCYYHLIYCLYKNALNPALPQATRTKYLTQAATFIIKLETNQANMGADHLKKRYEDLLAKEPLLKEAYKKEGGTGLVK